MDRFRATANTLSVVLILVGLVPAAGCSSILATGVYLWEGGHKDPAECRALERRRVVVLCQAPSSQEYRFADASREIAKRVSFLLDENVKGIDVVNPREVDNWIDVSDGGDFKELGAAVKADLVLVVDLDSFDIFNGETLYQGTADVTLSLYDMKQKGELVWDKPLGDVLYPVNSGIPTQDKSERKFEREFIAIISGQVARHFYEHDAHVDFAIDALANR